MNVFCVCGRVEEMPELKETPSGIKMSTVPVKVQRPFANTEGIYEYDTVQLEVWRGLAETICNICEPGSWVSAKGRISSRNYEKDGRTYTNYNFVVEKLEVLH